MAALTSLEVEASMGSSSYLDINDFYTRKAEELLAKLGVKGFVRVVELKDNLIPQCGIACSAGMGGSGFIFINRKALDNLSMLRGVEDYILAHEIAHIARSHSIATYFLKLSLELTGQILREASKTLVSSKDFLGALGALLTLISSTLAYMEFAKVDVDTIRKQELEADDIAIRLIGCHKALKFAEILEQLKQHGIWVSHYSTVGLPALTVDERINFIRERCQQSGKA